MKTQKEYLDYEFSKFKELFGDYDDKRGNLSLTNFLLYLLLKKEKINLFESSEDLTSVHEDIIELGKKKGSVTSSDINCLTKSVKKTMNKLVSLKYFKRPEDKGTYIRWEYNKTK